MEKEPGTVLLADDEPGILKVMQTFVSAAGHAVLTARDGKEALEKTQSALPDVVVLDIGMPCLTGFEVAEALRGQKATRDLPIIFVTARKDIDDKLTGLDLANDYIVKPFEPLELLARINASIRIKKLQDQLKARTAELAALSFVDELTGLYSRRYLDERLDEEIARARRYFYPLACLLMRVDRLEELRAQLGEEESDALLKEVAQLVRDSMRVADFVARFDEAEIFCILPSTDASGARIVAEGLRSAVERQFVPTEARPFAVTVSAGTAHAGASELRDRTSLMRRVQRAVEAAHEQGGNSVVCG